ncbi:MAG: hypothetical protein LBS09_01505 [Bacteroidales bacterium]|jgi:hypothetical protein|nr:hypothetical protein [Bacteroidales bacterium]
MLKKIWYVPLWIIVVSQTVSCTCSRTQQDGNDFVVPDSVHNVSIKISDNLVKEIVDNISSPIETAALFKSLNVPFSQKYLATTKNLSDYNTAYDKAFNLGVFGADLGYLNMYGKTSMVSVYIVAMKNLAEGLNIGQFFNYATLKRLSDNNESIDSLINISQQSFNRMDRYLRQSGRGNLSIVMISGVWMEAMYLSCRFYEESSNARLAESIGEQKLLLNELVKMLGYYQNQKEIAALILKFAEIQEAYAPVEITMKEGGAPDRIEQDGSLRIVQHDSSIVTCTEEQLRVIIDEIKRIREELTK